MLSGLPDRGFFTLVNQAAVTFWHLAKKTVVVDNPDGLDQQPTPIYAWENSPSRMSGGFRDSMNVDETK